MRFVLLCYYLLTILLGSNIGSAHSDVACCQPTQEDVSEPLIPNDDDDDESGSDNETDSNGNPLIFKVIWIDNRHHVQCHPFSTYEDAERHYQCLQDNRDKLIRYGGAIWQPDDSESDGPECSDSDSDDGEPRQCGCDPHDPDDPDLHLQPSMLRYSYSRANLSEYIHSTEDLFQSVNPTSSVSIEVVVIKSAWVQYDGDGNLSPQMQGALFSLDNGSEMTSALSNYGFSAATIFSVFPHHDDQQTRPSMFWILSNLRRKDRRYCDDDASDLKEALMEIGENERVRVEVLMLSTLVPFDHEDDDFAEDKQFYEHKLTKHSARKIISELIANDSSLRSLPMTMSAIKPSKPGYIKVWDCPAAVVDRSESDRDGELSSFKSLFKSMLKLDDDIATSSRSSASALPSSPSSACFLSRMYTFGDLNFAQSVLEPYLMPEVTSEFQLKVRCSFRLDSNSKIRTFTPEPVTVVDPYKYELPEHVAEHKEIELDDLSSDKFVVRLYDDMALDFFSPNDDALITLQDVERDIHDHQVWHHLHSDDGVSVPGIFQSLVETIDRPPAIGYRTDFTVKGMIIPGRDSRITLGSYAKASKFEARAVAGPCTALVRGPTLACGCQLSISGFQAFATADLCKLEANVCGLGLGIGLSLRTGVCIGTNIGGSLLGFGFQTGTTHSIWTPFAEINIPIA